jgi:hypothetical protein
MIPSKERYRFFEGAKVQLFLEWPNNIQVFFTFGRFWGFGCWVLVFFLNNRILNNEI